MFFTLCSASRITYIMSNYSDSEANSVETHVDDII